MLFTLSNYSCFYLCVVMCDKNCTMQQRHYFLLYFLLFCSGVQVLFVISIYLFAISIYLFVISIYLIVISIYLCVLVSNTISILDDVHVVKQRRDNLPLVVQELFTLPEHLRLRVCATQSFALCVVLCAMDYCSPVCQLSFGRYIACTSSIYSFWLPFLYVIFTSVLWC